MATILPPELVVGAPCYRCRQIAAEGQRLGNPVNEDMLTSIVAELPHYGVECKTTGGEHNDTHPYDRWVAALQWYKNERGNGVCAEYPHRCPRCAGPAYVGFATVDCQAKCETRSVLTKETAPCKAGGAHVWQVQRSVVTGRKFLYCVACDVVQ